MSPAHGDQWERQLNAEAADQSMSMTADDIRNSWSSMHKNRREQLERGMHLETAFDIEDLPPTAAGPQGRTSMGKDWGEVEMNRRRQLERGLY